MELIVLGIVFLVGAWAAQTYVAGPAGTFAAVVLALVGAICLIVGLFDVLDEAGNDRDRRGGGIDIDAVAPLLGAWLLRR